MENKTELTYKEKYKNVIGCLEYLMGRVSELITDNDEASLSEDEMVCEDAKQALEFLYELEITAISSNEEWAEYIASALGYSRDEEDAILHDLNNLRADEVLEVVTKNFAMYIVEAFCECYKLEIPKFC